MSSHFGTNEPAWVEARRHEAAVHDLLRRHRNRLPKRAIDDVASARNDGPHDGLMLSLLKGLNRGSPVDPDSVRPAGTAAL